MTKEEQQNTAVEEALMRRAVGYEFTEKKTEFTDKGEKTVETVKHVPGDVGAMLAWLKNRRPDRWKDKPEPVGDPAQQKAHQDFLEALRDSARQRQRHQEFLEALSGEGRR